MLEEVGLPYTVHEINIGQGDQMAPEFLAISPNNKIPAIVDSDGPGGEPVSIFESAAILIYLAEKPPSSFTWPKKWEAIFIRPSPGHASRPTNG